MSCLPRSQLGCVDGTCVEVMSCYVLWFLKMCHLEVCSGMSLHVLVCYGLVYYVMSFRVIAISCHVMLRLSVQKMLYQ